MPKEVDHPARRRELALRAGTLRREMDWSSTHGDRIRVRSERLVSFVQRSVAASSDDFKKVFVDALFARVQKDPQSVALTWMSEAARRHVHGFECPDFIDLVSASNFAE